VSVGWSEDEVEYIYTQALVAYGVPLPKTGNSNAILQKNSAADIIISIFSFALLGTLVTAMISLFFGIIEYAFPDKLTDYFVYTSRSESIHYATAALIIGLPLYSLSMYVWFKRFRESGEKKESSLTRGITYAVLLLSTMALAGDLITVIYTYLQGEITARFFLKAIVVLCISGVVFGFYFLERKKIQYKKDVSRNTFRFFGLSVSIIVIIGILFGFIATGSPETARKKAFDNRRSEDLSALEYCIQVYTERYKRLPENIQALKTFSDISYCPAVTDPETGSMYEYSIVSQLQRKDTVLEGEFEMCAYFAFDTTQEKLTETPMNNKWQIHSKGKYCSKLSITATDTTENQAQITPFPK